MVGVFAGKNIKAKAGERTMQENKLPEFLGNINKKVILV